MPADLNTSPAAEALPAWLQHDQRPLWCRPAVRIGALTLLATVMAASLWQMRNDDAARPIFVTQALTRGDVALTVSANGTLQPTRSVSLGSELSGTVAEVLVDVNDRVRKGQVLVKLDTAKLNDQVTQAQANLSAAEATLATARASLKEMKLALARQEEAHRLSGGRVPAATDLDSARAAVDKAIASEASALAGVDDMRAALSTNRTNLSKASIRSPIDGVILTRSVEPGNAVAASLQAVTLFTLAEDLTQLKLSVNVDEADVSQISSGQSARFSVSAWPGRSYPANVTRVAFGSTTTDNVVTYTTQLAVDNKDLSLRPGMTATAQIAASRHTGVWVVPVSALSFSPAAPAGGPPPSGAAPKRSMLETLMPGPPGGSMGRKPAGMPGAAAAAATNRAGRQQQIWVLEDGVPVPMPVKIGLSNGQQTEISADGLREGLAVITEQRSASAKP
ncbi:MAG: efflux transporter periplasmic adaptor subunit [Burkholderiales bacterium PBB6]|nr:MAG: efflux transporter periplasmic adaptor subunit [Burkholderiales bacterium PBB6]